jgi:hypothetical protein
MSEKVAEMSLFLLSGIVYLIVLCYNKEINRRGK